ncbi:uncharacterized protein LOC123205052 isoform X2 [Mangifera indica]|nr:uncharacterized protein LOC123205052 isoform X2 [Mangifera indica]XP_044477780.1 uncharacterized protein LOC123205052 isoform X2 [Mangifera indica]
MYLYNYKTNFHNLERGAGKLKDARDEVKAKVVAAEKNVEKVKQNVKDWEGDVDSTIEETEKLIQEKSNSSCFNLITCYKNGRKAWKKLNAITELLQEKETFAQVSLPTTDEVIRLTNKDYEEFESRRSIFNDVLKALDDPEVGVIGVNGMGGIGKTTLVKEVGHQAKKNLILDEVVFVEVSDKPDPKKIQDELARQLGVKFDPEADRASKLYARLKNDKKVLVILDNIWEQIDLEALGIPCGDDRGGCKLLLTARDLNVLWSMDSKNNFSMGVLKEEEAWSLFKKMAGDVVDRTNKLNSLPNDVCIECRGLPIVITTIARALRYKRHQSEWKDALRELKKPSPTKFAGLPEKEYAKIALSYNYLKRDELKETLLICSLMVNNSTILDLFKLIMSLNILKGANFTMEETRNKLESLVYELKYSCLLLDGSTNERLSMHDVVRSVVITIAYKDHHVFTERNDIRVEWSDKEQLKKCTKISLIDCNMISEIWSQGLDCPKLEFFSLVMDDSFEVLEDFFSGMRSLKVLSFFHLDVLSLPTSLAFLTNLETLCLDNGSFSDITVIGELRKLKILSLRYCEIKQLAGEISKLTQLRLLDLSCCWKLEVIVPNVISSLSLLEEVYMSRCSISWKLDILEELMGLSNLTALKMDISDDQILPKDFISKKLERYKISIGNKAIDFGRHFIYGGDYSKYMKVKSYSLNKPASLRTLKLNLNFFIWQEELQLLSNVEFLCLDKLQGIKNDLSELDKKGFSHLKYLYVHNNLNISCIIDSTKCTPHDVFPLLESLVFFNLTNLEKICYGLPSTKSFFHLKFIEVKSCDKLENIFSFSNASKSLPQLQLIKVEDCNNLTEIFAVESKNRADKNEVIDKIEFCQLRFLTLINLPRITSFYSNANTVSTSQKTQKELTINLESNDIISEDEEIDTVIPFFNQKVVFPCLEELNLRASNSEKIWDNKLPTTSCCYQNLKKLIVDGCQKLKFVFPSSIIKSFEQLQHLEISCCKELKEIIAKEETEGTTTFIFPRVTFLKFKELSELTTLYNGKYNSNWPMLKELKMCDCSKLDIFPSEYKVVVPNLEVLKLRSVNFEILWDSQLVATSSCYQNLTSLILNGCEKLQYVFLSSMVKSFERLEHIEICNCSVLKEIISKGVEANKIFVFSRVTFLKLKNLPELATFYPGVHTSEWPVLKKLEVCNCDKIKTFSSEYMSFSDNNEGQHDIWEKQSLFLAEKVVFPCLKILKLGATNFEKIWDNKLPTTSCRYQNLKKLIVDGCQKLKFVFPSSIIKSFEQLQHLEISCCEELKEIIAKEETEDTTTFIFPRVAFLKLKELSKLTTFYHGKHNSNWPMLKELEVHNCGRLDMFTSEYKINLNLKKLTLSRADDMIKLLHQFPENFCRCTIEIKQDKSTNISVGILQRPVKLEKLILTVCSYEEIFTRGEDEKHTKILIQIKSLELRGLSDAKYLWGKGSKLDSLLQNLEVLEVNSCVRMINVLPSSASFENLTVLNVDSCYGLMNLLTPSMAKILVQLREMEIRFCIMMTEIVSNKTEDVAAEDEIVFGKLKLLSLVGLKSLTCFCSGSYALKFPCLEELTVSGCPGMKTFFAGNLYTPSLQKVREDWTDASKRSWKGNLNATIQQLYEKKVNSKSEKLILSGKDVTLIWQEQFSKHQFSKVKFLKIIKDESSNISIGILQRFNNLQKLVLQSSSYKEIFSCEKDEKDVSMLTQIKELKLWGLFNLEYMWKEKSHLDSILQNLEMLGVKFCHNLISIVSSSTTFENLITLRVSYCDGLINLVSSSTAKSLVRLEELSLSECKMMAEVVSSEGGTKAEEIVFDKLKLLSLYDLKNLTSFSSGNYVFKFPALKKLIVWECHNMKTFFEGVLSVPSLRKVKQGWHDELGCWEGALNTTIQFLHRKKCSGIILSVAKLSPGHAAYRFLVSYQNGKFVLAYCKFPCVDLLELAKAFLSKIKYQSQVLNQFQLIFLFILSSFWFQVFCSRIDCGSSASLVPCIVLSFQNQPLQLLTCCACHGITAAVGFFCRIQSQIFSTSLPRFSVLLSCFLWSTVAAQRFCFLVFTAIESCLPSNAVCSRFYSSPVLQSV